MSYALTYECSRCVRIFPLDGLQGICHCGGPLLTRYDLARMRQELHPSQFEKREPAMFRYAELLPLRKTNQCVTLGEGMTPLVPVPGFTQALDLNQVWVKDEGANPTGTFKARGAALGLTRLRELGVQTVVLPTAGNAGGAWATYGARADIETVVIMPKQAPAINKGEAELAGGKVYLVDGLISDAGKIAAKMAQDNSWFDAATLKEPFRIEGKKTMGLEIAEQLGWTLPDVVVYPAGGGVGLIGMWKAFQELLTLGWVKGPLPRLVAAQAAGCAPIVRAWQAEAKECAFWEDATTVASGLCVPKPLGDRLILKALKESRGTAVAMSDEQITETFRSFARLEGIVVCPEGATAIAAAHQLRRTGWLTGSETVVILNTGTGLKYPHLLRTDLPHLEPAA